MRTGANSAAARRWLGLAVHDLRESAELLNALNVFPVADADTGTNLVITVGTAADAVDVLETPDVGELLMLAGQAALDDARGNSGSLFAVWLTALGAALEGGDGFSADALSRAMQAAEVRCWSALTDPVPGTMLSVLRDIAEVAVPEAGDAGSRRQLIEFMEAAVAAAHRSVLGSSEQLETLRGTQRVDSGALGMLIILNSLRRSTLKAPTLPQALWGGVPEAEQDLEAVHRPVEDEIRDLLERMRRSVSTPETGFEAGAPSAEGGGAAHGAGAVVSGVEVVATVELTALEAAAVRHELAEIGDSVIASPISRVEDETWRWRIHVHVPDQLGALSVLRRHGSPRSISVTDLSAPPSNEGGWEGGRRVEGRDDRPRDLG